MNWQLDILALRTRTGLQWVGVPGKLRATYLLNTRKADRELKKKKRTGRWDRKRKAGTSRSNSVSGVGKEEREREGERKRESKSEREMRSIFIHPVSTN